MLHYVASPTEKPANHRVRFQAPSSSTGWAWFRTIISGSN